uniref:Predicted protein n=1 Tax=Hordeum vulgare subsp. vulgare TaxID=112509 RepID=F2DH93_HORVV|nr:predicted protein [Hordeum vulgare subsp. vulgare]
MAAPTVTKSPPALVPPAGPTPGGTLPLSSIDKTAAVRVMVDFIQVFQSPPSSDADDQVAAMRQGFARALVPYYPVAGRIAEPSPGEPVVDCTAEGVWFVEAAASCSLADVNGLEDRPRRHPQPAQAAARPAAVLHRLQLRQVHRRDLARQHQARQGPGRLRDDPEMLHLRRGHRHDLQVPGRGHRVRARRRGAPGLRGRHAPPAWQLPAVAGRLLRQLRVPRRARQGQQGRGGGVAGGDCDGDQGGQGRAVGAVPGLAGRRRQGQPLQRVAGLRHAGGDGLEPRRVQRRRLRLRRAHLRLHLERRRQHCAVGGVPQAAQAEAGHPAGAPVRRGAARPRLHPGAAQARLVGSPPYYFTVPYYYRIITGGIWTCCCC